MYILMKKILNKLNMSEQYEQSDEANSKDEIISDIKSIAKVSKAKTSNRTIQIVTIAFQRDARLAR